MHGSQKAHQTLKNNVHHQIKPLRVSHQQVQQQALSGKSGTLQTSTSVLAAATGQAGYQQRFLSEKRLQSHDRQMSQQPNRGRQGYNQYPGGARAGAQRVIAQPAPTT